MLTLTGAVALWLLATAWRGTNLAAAPSGLVLCGAGANVADRAIDGTLVDLIDLGWWPTFNLADAAIVVGVSLHHLSASAAATAENTPPEGGGGGD